MPDPRFEPVEFEGVIVKAVTDKALLCAVDGQEVWIPKSQLHPNGDLDEESVVDEEGTLAIPAWLAEEKELG